MRRRTMPLLLTAVLWSGCAGEAPPPAGWIQGSSHQRWQAMERQLRGLDVAMLEIGQRYQELYWSGSERAWPYAGYQAAKIRLALENALERRPKRRASAEAVFVSALDEIARAIAEQQGSRFDAAFEHLTAACNQCHGAEGVATFRVAPPRERRSLIHAPE